MLEAETDTLYTGQFFQIFAAVILFMTAVALQFHFGEYIAYLGHGVDTLGRVLGVSMVGTLLIRLQLGRWIDRFGCRPTWIVGTLLVAIVFGSIQFVERLWLIAVLRTVSTMAIAGVMTTVAVFAAQIAPPRRRAESIGTMGLAGLLGMIVGPTLGDWIFSDQTGSITPHRIFFSASAVCSLLAGGIMALASLPASCGPASISAEATSSSSTTQPRRAKRTTPSTLSVIFAHWPGGILLVGLVFSMVFCLQIAFLERLAEDRGFKNVKVFFLVYGPTAMALRVIFRRVPERLGRSRTLLGGLLLLATGLVCLIGIQSEGGLILPGLLMGAGHSFIFPSMVDLSAERFPPELRGTGTSLILGAGDVGMLTGFFCMGELIDRSGFDAALSVLAVAILTGATVFSITRRGDIFRSRANRR
ncbi:MAG: MFS transporter [Planctomycetota bacterium]|jgi:MFS family permease